VVDQRIDRSRTALKQALFKLLLTRTYRSITVEDIVLCAGVARSTFYVHYKDKDALLSGTVSGQTAVLGQLASEGAQASMVVKTLDHFVWAGPAASTLLTPDISPIISAAIAAHIEHHLRARGLHRPGRLLVSSTMLSAMLADAILAAIRIWLASPRRMSSEDLASALTRQASAMIKASMAGTPLTADA
jgi:AcrR family transcriptional regulator